MSVHAPQTNHASGRATTPAHGAHLRGGTRPSGAGPSADGAVASFAGLLQAQTDAQPPDAQASDSWAGATDPSAMPLASPGLGDAGVSGLTPAWAAATPPNAAAAQAQGATQGASQTDGVLQGSKAKTPVSQAQHAQDAPDSGAIQGAIGDAMGGETGGLTRWAEAPLGQGAVASAGPQGWVTDQPLEHVQPAQGAPDGASGAARAAALVRPSEAAQVDAQSALAGATTGGKSLGQKQPQTPVNRAQAAINAVANNGTQPSVSGTAAQGARDSLERVLAAVSGDVQRGASPDPVGLAVQLAHVVEAEGPGAGVAAGPARGAPAGIADPGASPAWLGQATSNGADGLAPDQQVLGAGEAAQIATPEETVRYWSGGAIDHAQVRVDAWGDAPLDVQIDLQAGQATIDFRTDQPELRAALNESAQPLRDLLAEQGLQLAGVSVGASGQDTAQRWPQAHTQAQPSAARFGGVRSTSGGADAAQVVAPRRALQGAGQTLDVFA